MPDEPDDEYIANMDEQQRYDNWLMEDDNDDTRSATHNTTGA